MSVNWIKRGVPLSSFQANNSLQKLFFIQFFGKIQRCTKRWLVFSLLRGSPKTYMPLLGSGKGQNIFEVKPGKKDLYTPI